MASGQSKVGRGVGESKIGDTGAAVEIEFKNRFVFFASALFVFTSISRPPSA